MEESIFITSVLPWPKTSGVHTKLGPLLDTAPVKVSVIGPEASNDGLVIPEGLSYAAVPCRSRSSADTLYDMARERLLPSQASIDKDVVLSQVSEVLDRIAYTCHVHLDTIATAHLADPIRQMASARGKRVFIIASINDSYSFLRSEAGGLKQHERVYIERNERRFLPQADLVDVVSAADVGWLARVAPKARSRVVPLAVQSEWSKADHGPAVAPERDLLLFSGGPGAEDFLRFGMPLLRQRHPNVRVSMAGPSPDLRLQKEVEREGVELLGFVPDISLTTRRSRLILAPSQQRCGVSNRAMMGFVNAACVVGGDCLTNFVGALPGREYLHGGTPQALAIRIAEALDDESLRVRIASRGMIFSRSLPTAQQVGEQYWSEPRSALVGVQYG